MKQFKVIMIDESGMLDEEVTIVKSNDITEAIKQYQETYDVKFDPIPIDIGKRIYKLYTEGYVFYFVECKFI